MSLEEALNRNTEALEKNNALMEKLLGASAAAAAKATGGPASSDDAEDKPKRTRTKKDDDAGTKETAKAVTLDDVKPILSGWLNEFPKDGDTDHPETAARKAAFKKKLDELGAANLPAVAADKLGDLKTWAEGMKAKGRLVQDEEEQSEDDMLG